MNIETVNCLVLILNATKATLESGILDAEASTEARALQLTVLEKLNRAVDY
jgi:hypothetical protein